MRKTGYVPGPSAWVPSAKAAEKEQPAERAAVRPEPDISDEVAAQVAQIMDDETKEETAEMTAADLYKTQILEQILSELESRD